MVIVFHVSMKQWQGLRVKTMKGKKQTIRLNLRTDTIDFVVREQENGFFNILSGKSVATDQQLDGWLLQVYQGEYSRVPNHIQLMFQQEAKKNACAN